jgi:two-component system, cell cycle sensor histidine kinase DivJ
MSLALKWGIWRTGVDTVSTICRNWVNADVAGREEVRLQARVVGLLFAVPLVSMLHLGVNLPHQISAGALVPMLGLAFGFPLVAAAALSMSGKQKSRSRVIALTAPIAFLAITGGRIGPEPLFFLILAISAFEAWRAPQARKPWIISIFALGAAAAATQFLAPFGAQIATNFAGMGTLALAATVYSIIAAGQTEEAELMKTLPDFALIEKLVAPTGALVFQMSRNGMVSQVSGNASSVLRLQTEDLAEKGFSERVHLADKVRFLTFLDTVRDQPVPQVTSFRLRSGRVSGQGVPEWVKFDAFARSVTDGIILTAVIDNSASQDGPSNAPGSDALAIVSHELRTPLNAIVGFSDMLRQEMFGPLQNDRQREYIDLVYQSGLHLLGVVNAMLDWSRIENGTMTLQAMPFEPTEAAAFAVGIVSSSAMAKKIGLDFQPASAFESFNGDQRVCQQILINLLSNAIKFTGEGGMIRLLVDVEDGRLLIVVEDNGIGMTLDQQRRVGTPFYQVNGGHARSHEGTGLGLALVKQMARLHGGSVEIDSVAGRGTKVTVALSTFQAKGQNAAPAQQAADESARIIRVFEERGHGTQRKTA